MSQIELAEAQFIGYAHASKGYSVKELAESMALTKKEWIKLRDIINLKESDKDDLNKMFGL